jgi:hypothetical protein
MMAADREPLLELLNGDDRHHARRAVALGTLGLPTDVIELAVIRPGPIRLFRRTDRHTPFTRERAHLTAEAITNLAEQRGRRDLEPEMVL